MNTIVKVESVIRKIEPEFPVKYIDVSGANAEGQLYIDGSKSWSPAQTV